MAENETTARPQFQYSVKLEMNSKGFIQPTIHCYGDTSVDVCDQAVMALKYVADELKEWKFKLANEMDDNVKVVKTAK